MSARRRVEGFPVVLAILVLLVMGISLATLLWLESRFEEQVEEDIEHTADLFAQSGALGEPLRPEGVRFRSGLLPLIETNRRGFIRDIWVTKMLGDGTEHLLAPLLGWHTTPNWRARVADWQRRELRVEGGEVSGHLYFDIDETWVARTALAARSVGGLMVLAVVALLTRLWGTSRRLGATTDALLERQRELIHLERLALAGQLSANVLHDLKKPVLNIRHGLDDLAANVRDRAEAKRSLGELQEQTALFQSILRETNLERFVQARDGDLEFLDAGEALRQATGLVQYERRDVEVVFEIADALPAVHGSRHRLVQVFSNLILNAYQAMEGRGRLTLRAASDGGAVLVEIADTGPGIAPALRDRLFEPFVTTKPTDVGTGLGLAICRLIVEEMEGTITAENASGGGAMFRVRLPGGGRP